MDRDTDEELTMHDFRSDAPLPRRALVARLTGAVLSVAGLSAFTRARPNAPTWDDRFELAVDLEIAAQEGFRYHRPYVAVWLEDGAGKAVRTLTLWVNTTGRGPRYIRELRRWFLGERDQEIAGGPDLVSTVSGATRLPGRYTVTWDGRDQAGKPVEQGTYRLFIEAAREHGTYQLMQQDLSLGTKPVAVDLPGNVEIKGARVEYRRRK
jgi:thiamine biosynthesis lipoprotein